MIRVDTSKVKVTTGSTLVSFWHQVSSVEELSVNCK